MKIDRKIRLIILRGFVSFDRFPLIWSLPQGVGWYVKFWKYVLVTVNNHYFKIPFRLHLRNAFEIPTNYIAYLFLPSCRFSKKILIRPQSWLRNSVKKVKKFPCSPIEPILVTNYRNTLRRVLPSFVNKKNRMPWPKYRNSVFSVFRGFQHVHVYENVKINFMIDFNHIWDRFQA